MTKNKISYLLAAILTFSFNYYMTSCKGNDDANSKDLAYFNAYTVLKDTSVCLIPSDSASPSCRLHIKMTFSKNNILNCVNRELLTSGIIMPDYFSTDIVAVPPKEAINLFSKRYIEEYKRDYKSLYIADKENPKSYNINYDVFTSVKQGRKGIVIYSSEATYNSGALHDTKTLIARNIDVRTKKILKLKDIIVEGAENFISELIVDALCKKYDKKDIGGLRDMSIFKGISPYPSDNFMLEKDGIVFIYNTDEIATHDIGRIVLKIDYSDINKYLKERV